MTSPEATTITIATAHGPVSGQRDGDAASFLGIPFGAPTDGPRRYGPPQAPEAWSSPLDCSRPGPSAPQNPSILEAALGYDGATYGEDCLRVNVFTPSADGAAPVMVWLHGGGYETGTPSMHWYDGQRLAARGVVVVAVGYRLGALGYLELPGVEGSGCFGLLDQIAGLRWVRDNVAAFGGDPGAVTVFGESAGAMSIGHLLAAPAAQGLFQRAILQSGATHNVWEPHRGSRSAERLAEILGVGRDDLAALRATSVADVLAAQAQIGRTDDGGFGLPWQPSIGTDVVPTPPLEAVAAGAAAGIELVIGTTLEEMRLFPLISPELAAVDEEALARRTRSYASAMGRDPESLLHIYEERTGHLAAPDRWLALLTDLVFRIPAIRLAEAQAAQGTDVRMYLFAEQSDAFGGGLGSCHALDLPYTFDRLDTPGTEILVGPITDDRLALAATMAERWTAFARGDAAGLADWPTYDLERRATLWLRAGEVEVVDDPMGDERAWWDGLPGGLDFDPALVS